MTHRARPLHSCGKLHFCGKLLSRLLRDERGLAAVEYGFLCALIVLVMISALSAMANAVQATWTNIATQSQNATAQAAG